MRIIPLRGSEEERVLNDFNIGEFELFFSSDQKRGFIGSFPICPVNHGNIANEATMLGLYGSSSRGCFPGDSCKRTDTGSSWLCKSNNGELLTDWIELTLDRGSAVADVNDANLPANGFIGGLTISNPPTQAEVQALRDECEKLRDVLAEAISTIETLRNRFRVTGGNGLISD